MDTARLQAWWAHRQGLDGSLRGRSAAEILERTGWARSVAGASPYLALFARGGLSRDAVDAEVAAVRIHELPSARGCTYILPAADYALGLTVGREFNDDLKQATKLGVTSAEIEKLCDAVLAALEAGPLDPAQLKRATGSTARSLGPEGVKKGLGSTMPVALGLLQSEGRIRRVPLNGRLDQQRYRYALWKPGELGRAKVSRDEAFSELARRYFRWIGPATLPEFQWFSGLGVKAAQAAVQSLRLVPWDSASGRLMFPDDQQSYQNFSVPEQPDYKLVGSLDGLSTLRRDVALLLDPVGAAQSMWTDKGMRPMGGLSDLPSHAILDRGRLMGLWEFDTSTNSIAWTAFDAPTDALLDEIARTERFVRDELGDARSFSLDSPKSRAPKISALRANRR